jgi:thymidylate synthase (FAD)
VETFKGICAMTITPEQQAELDENNTHVSSSVTQRPCVPALEEIIGKVHPVLDHGFIRVIDYMGDDAAITQAARVSYGRGTKRVSEDRGLIEYLIRHRHSTPLEQCIIKYHMKLPIFVARQLIRHRTASVNEYSARYSILAKEFYFPKQENVAPQSKTNRQGRSDEHLDDTEYERTKNTIFTHSHQSYDLYTALLAEEDDPHNFYYMQKDFPGIARELARMVLPLNVYTEWYWTIDLHNLLHFLSLRMDKHAQWEIRAYASIMGDIVAKWCPFAWDAWNNCVFNGVHLTKKQWDVLCYLMQDIDVADNGFIQGEDIFAKFKEHNNIGKREYDELIDIIKTEGIS